MLCFHGFGQDGRVFKAVAESLTGYTLFSFDLPFHGETHIEDPSIFMTTRQAHALVQKLVQIKRITKFSVLAYSIGARLAISIVNGFAQNIENVWLLAPDGIVQNFWYAFATKNGLNRRIFSFFMRNPQVIFSTTRLLKSLKLLDPSMQKVIAVSMATEDKRAQVYWTWTFLSPLQISLGKLSGLATENDLEIEVFVGEKDRIIPQRGVKKKANGKENIKVISLQSGHNDLIKNFAKRHFQ